MTSVSLPPVTGPYGGLNGYWGQLGSDPLKAYCDSRPEYVTLSFVNQAPENTESGYPGTNFAGHCAAGTYEGSSLLTECYVIMDGIPYCQERGVKVLLSIGGVYNEQGSNYKVSTDDKGVDFANFLHNAFGPYDPDWDGPRPFDKEDSHPAVDGFDFDIEHDLPNGPYIAMINEFRRLREDIIITGAPQCPTSSQYFVMSEMIKQAKFDALFVQFYNNPYCDAIIDPNTSGDRFNYEDWVSIIEDSDCSKDAKLYVGLPASRDAAGSGYLEPEEMKDLVCAIKDDAHFGGISLWDLTRGASNQVDGKSYNEHVMDALLYGCDPVPVVTTTTTEAASTTTTDATTADTTATSDVSTTDVSTVDVTTTSGASTTFDSMSTSDVSTVPTTTTVSPTTDVSAVSDSMTTSEASTVSGASSTDTISTADTTTTSDASTVSDASTTEGITTTDTATASDTSSTEDSTATSGISTASDDATTQAISTSDVFTATDATSATGAVDSTTTTVTTSETSSTVIGSSTDLAQTSTIASASETDASSATTDLTATTEASAATDATTISTTNASFESNTVTGTAQTTDIAGVTETASETEPTDVATTFSTFNGWNTTYGALTNTRIYGNPATLIPSGTATTTKESAVYTNLPYKTTGVSMTTSTVCTTRVHTEGGYVVTETIPLYTTVCPVTNKASPTNYAVPPQYTVSSRCPPEAVDCPYGSVTTETIPVYTTVCPVTETGKTVPTNIPGHHEIKTLYTNQAYTITQCPADEPNCVAGAVKTEVASWTTTIVPVKETQPVKVYEPVADVPKAMSQGAQFNGTVYTNVAAPPATLKTATKPGVFVQAKPTYKQPVDEQHSGVAIPTGVVGGENHKTAPAPAETCVPTPMTPVTAGASTLAVGLTAMAGIALLQMLAL
ncbi:endochitinase 2 precursor [Fusarium heterosporum]|uniref:chitinase n=1 Tax=Fusarium heterosporum TaxID=42747 RepID=A0A8H5TJR7_FUSHE|nr:endochitinase 2 precursor [Fusarium heterosporum]